MTTIQDDKLFTYADRVKGKVVIITGGANGIGKQATEHFASYGAKVVIGDLDVAGGERLVAQLAKSGGQAIFQRCDVLSWDDQVNLYEYAVSTYGAVDIVVANAGVSELGKFDQVELNEKGRPVKPNLKTLDINLTAVLYTTHLSLHYLQLNRTPGSLKALILLGSMASWSGIRSGTLYTASKHAVLGIMRSQYPTFLEQDMRIAVIHPWFADTAILPVGVKVLLAGIPLTPVDRIAGAIFYTATDPSPETNGSAWLLPDDGPVYRIDREEFKLGVYGMIDQRVKRLSGFASGIVLWIALFRDLGRIFATPLFVMFLGIGLGWFGWSQRGIILN